MQTLIFILTDDQRLDALGYAGNELIHTAEMDRLAATGTYFKNAMVSTPGPVFLAACTNVRTALISKPVIFGRNWRHILFSGTYDFSPENLADSFNLLFSFNYNLNVN